MAIFSVSLPQCTFVHPTHRDYIRDFTSYPRRFLAHLSRSLVGVCRLDPSHTFKSLANRVSEGLSGCFMPIDSFTYDSFAVSQSGYYSGFPVME